MTMLVFIWCLLIFSSCSSNGKNVEIEKFKDNKKQGEYGPYFVSHPSNVVLDINKKSKNYINMTCIARGSPKPTYEWFKENYDNEGLLTYSLMDPLKNNRLLIDDGKLIIKDPSKIEDTGIYHCKAKNKFGAIISNSITVYFGFIGDFNDKRSDENGEMNRGFVLSCDPPQYFPSVEYFWVKDAVLNIVREDERTFLSKDGSLFFSALQKEDSGRYSCNVKNRYSDTGKMGPFFQLNVNFHSGYDQMRFPAHFPKIFPKTPYMGKEVRIECFVYSRSTPSYDWKRTNSPLPKSAYLINLNRVLVIPNPVKGDEGEYTCVANNGFEETVEKSIYLTLEAEPVIVKNLTVMTIQHNSFLTCVGFGQPNVTYSWLKNGQPLIGNNKYFMQQHILIIYDVENKDAGMYQCCAENTYNKMCSYAELRIPQKNLELQLVN